MISGQFAFGAVRVVPMPSCARHLAVGIGTAFSPSYLGNPDGRSSDQTRATRQWSTRFAALSIFDPRRRRPVFAGWWHLIAHSAQHYRVFVRKRARGWSTTCRCSRTMWATS